MKIFRCDAGVVKYIARLLLRRDARLCGQIAGADDVDFAVVEYGSGVAKDEVHAALNVRVKKILAAEVGKQGVLVSEKTAALEDGTVRSHRDGYRLAGISRGVFKGEVIRLKRVAVHLDGTVPTLLALSADQLPAPVLSGPAQVAPGDVAQALAVLQGAGQEAAVIGEVRRGSRGVVIE